MKTKQILDTYRQKQSFRVAVGKSKWIDYEPENFNPEYNLREILNDEIVIEFDLEDQEVGNDATMLTLFNLVTSGYECEVWGHGGRSPHIHIHNLPISHLEKDQRKLFKKLFIRKHVPIEFLEWVDISLTGIHLLRIEHSPCWKKKYGIKTLMARYNPNIEPYKSQIKNELEWRK